MHILAAAANGKCRGWQPSLPPFSPQTEQARAATRSKGEEEGAGITWQLQNGLKLMPQDERGR